jgi:hypothetical protein
MLGGAAQKELLKQITTRARVLPLDVKVYVDPYSIGRDTMNIDYLWGEAAKIRSLAIRAHLPVTVHASLRNHGTVIEAPLLERLTLETSQDSVWVSVSNLIGALPYQIKAPKLKQITALNHILPNCSLLPSTLQELHFAQDVAPSLNLLAELPRFAGLKRLTLQCVFNGALPPAQPIHLPHLTQLMLHTNTELLLYLITNMEVPPHCIFDLCVGQSQLHLLPGLSKVIGKKAKCVLQGRPSDDPSIDLELWKDGKITFRLLAGSADASPPHLQISVHPKRRHLALHQKAMIFSSLLEEIPAVTKMKIRVFGSVDGSLAHILSKTPMLTVTDLTLYDPQPYLWTEICTFERSQPNYIPLPSLQVLRIVGKTDTLTQIKGTKVAGLTGIKQLLSTVEHRSTATTPSPLEVIDIRELDPQDSLYVALSEAAPTLEGLGIELQYRV